MSGYVCKIEETVDRLVDQKIRKCRYGGRLSDLEEVFQSSGDFVKAFFVDVCAERERYLSDRTDRQLRERLRDGGLFELLKTMSKIIGMKSLFGISTREEYLEWIEGERELDFQCV